MKLNLKKMVDIDLDINSNRIMSMAILTFICFLFIIPFYWMVVSSFKASGAIFTSELRLLPKEPILKNYIDLLDTPFLRWYINSLIFSGGYVFFGLFVCGIAGFAFAKYDFKYKNTLFMIIVGAQMLPIHIQIIPLFVMLTKVKLINTYAGLILPMIANPMGLFFIRQNMVGIDDDLLNAARVDGASEWEIFYKIVLPISKPALAAMAILFSIRSWNNLLWPLVVMRTEKMFTLTVGLSSLVGQYRPQYGMLMAGSFLAVLPIVIFFLKMQDYFISGLTAGSIKG
ncbi:arabinose ABC transporter permease AraQ [Halanaerocella petrolearia]